MNKFQEFMNRPISDTIQTVKENWKKKHHPVQYVTEQYVENLELNKDTNYQEVSKTLIHLSTAEKNYSANNMKPSIVRKFLSICGSLLTVLTITQAERFDTFPTKAWPFVFKDRDND